jgi:monothiol glutaredoxin
MNEELKNKIQEMVDSSKVFLFMKGTPEQPQCGFSARVVEVLANLGIKFNSFNVYSDPLIREGVKEFTNWPTIPQLYIDSKFIGGCDIVVSMSENGELQKFFSV